ncbi:MAG: tetratricopeptide repeat protein [Flavobacteriales bacterium]|nr:tetratricopeptide repeat protein [Flavobacteriales bacterium]
MTLSIMRNIWQLLAVVMIATTTGAQAQHDETDSSAQALWSTWANEDLQNTERLEGLEKFIRLRFEDSDPDSTLHYADVLYTTAERWQDSARMATALILQGNALKDKGDAVSAKQRHLRSLQISRSTGNKKGMARALNSLGVTELANGDHINAVAHLSEGLKLAEAVPDSSLIGRILGNIGILHHNQGDTESALSYYMRRQQIAEALDQSDILAEVIMNIGLIQAERSEHALADSSFLRALELTRSIGYHGMELLCLLNLGWHKEQLGDLAAALIYDREALTLADRIGDKAGSANARVALGAVYLLREDIPAALRYANEGLAIARGSQNPRSVMDAAEVLFDIHKIAGNYSEALTMHELFQVMRDSLKNDENKQAVMQQRFQYDFDKKEALLVAEQEKKDAVAAEEMRRKDVQRNAFIGGFGLMLLLAGTFFFQRNRISKEKARSEELLLNILPKEVAEELKAKGEADAKQIDQVTVLFTDFKGFTAMSEKLSPKELVADIHECFSAFDHIIAKHGIEKIKTIGDAYMAAGGLPRPNTTHASDVVKAALEIRDFIAEGKSRKVADGLPYFEIRIGIHTGPVVAGIVGVKKFAYDIWGDTVNIASRMESSGEVGQVNISESTYALVKDEPGLMFTSRGKVQAKGKGEMEMYFASNA